MRSKSIGLGTAAVCAIVTLSVLRVTAQITPADRVAAAAIAMSVQTRIKDVASLQKAPPLPLVGYGLVIGLTKTGDKQQTLFATQSLVNVLRNLGVTVPAEQVKVENI